jgi:hypothetical protein
MEVVMQSFIQNENIALYKVLIAESARDPSRDEHRHKMLLTLLAEEEAKHGQSPDSQTFATLFAETLLIATLHDDAKHLPDV